MSPSNDNTFKKYYYKNIKSAPFGFIINGLILDGRIKDIDSSDLKIARKIYVLTKIVNWVLFFICLFIITYYADIFISLINNSLLKVICNFIIYVIDIALITLVSTFFTTLIFYPFMKKRDK